ncbi:MAG: hypothetical protein EBS42_08740 [Caulobacteraceae bacterium]|jgi:hypothetical protein|nr:hypothetical protein [Caulobacteraceae bacterium]
MAAKPVSESVMISRAAHLKNAASGAGIVLLAGAALLAVLPAQAADPGKLGRASALKAVTDCRAITDPAARLACYDQATAALDVAEAKGDVVIVDREQVKQARQAAFGFNFRLPGFMTQGEQPEALSRLTTTIASARQDPRGRWTITLQDGAVWRQIDTEKLRRAPAPGTAAELRTAALGSYFMKIEGLGVIRAKREN